jgi:hypothetical protein
MKIPNSIKIGAYTYKILKINDRQSKDGSPNPATINTRKQIIWIDAYQHQEQQESSLIHEILEVLDYQFQLKLDHDNQLSVLEAGIYQVLKDNKLIK